MRQRVLPRRGSPHRLGFWGRSRECVACANRQSFRLSFPPRVMRRDSQATGLPIYLYIGLHPAPVLQASSYIYIYRNAPSSLPYLRYVGKGQKGSTYVYLTYVAGPSDKAPKSQRKLCRLRDVGESPHSPHPAPKTKAASARSAETARAASARTFFFNRHSETKRGVFVTPPSRITSA